MKSDPVGVIFHFLIGKFHDSEILFLKSLTICLNLSKFLYQFIDMITRVYNNTMKRMICVWVLVHMSRINNSCVEWHC